MLSASDSKDSDDKRVDERPDETGHGVEVVAEQLHAESGGIVDCDVVSQDGEDEEHEAEFREVERVEGFSEETA